jgi:peptidyl-prolyl cis-trans isomerase A (cyclophilin A)
MPRRFIALAILSLLATPAFAQTAVWAVPGTHKEPTMEVRKVETVRVILETSEGPILLELEKERAPITTANFLRYLDEKRLDGISFYRAMKIAPGYGLVQGGARHDPKRILPPIAHEPTNVTGLTHGDATISMARTEPGSANMDFFITVGAMPTFDAQPEKPGDNLGFAAFGRVVEGMDVIRRMLDAPTSPTEGEGVMKGQMLSPPIKIVSARRAD